MTKNQENRLMVKYGIVAWGCANGEGAYDSIQRLSQAAPCLINVILVDVPVGYAEGGTWKALVLVNESQNNPSEAATNFVSEWCKIVVEEKVIAQSIGGSHAHKTAR